MHIFETERLYFRQFTIDDAWLIFQLNRNPEVINYLHAVAGRLPTGVRKIWLSTLNDNNMEN